MPFKPGNQYGVKGRPPKEHTFSGLISAELEKLNEDGIPHKIVIVNRLIAMATKSNDMIAIATIKLIIDRIDGLAKQSIDAEIKTLSYNVIPALAAPPKEEQEPEEPEEQEEEPEEQEEEGYTIEDA